MGIEIDGKVREKERERERQRDSAILITYPNPVRSRADVYFVGSGLALHEASPIIPR